MKVLNTQKLSKNILNLREKFEMSVLSLSKESGVSCEMILAIEKCRLKKIDFTVIELLADSFGVEVEFLIGDYEALGCIDFEKEFFYRKFCKLPKFRQDIVIGA